MASTEGPARAHDRHARRRPFANWMKRLANLKNIHSDATQSRQSNNSSTLRGKKLGLAKNIPYSPSREHSNKDIHQNTSSLPPSDSPSRQSSFSDRRPSNSLSQDLALNGGNQPKSRAPTLATTADTTHSDAGRSGAGTSNTVARTEGDRDSTFSSPAPSLRSMTTTLTTMQSTTPVTAVPVNHASNAAYNYSSPLPASAVPAHLAPHAHTATYHTATANNMLSDDASILTLASSSKRRRRNSLDTNASIRALAPASMFGGSRESLPLSVLSAAYPRETTMTPTGDRDRDNASFKDSASINTHYPRSTSAMNAERASLISASGVTAPALTSDRNSYMSSKFAGDGGSMRSGYLGNSSERDKSLYHARNDSIGGVSITRERYKDTPQDYFKDKKEDKEMVTAPTSPLPA